MRGWVATAALLAMGAAHATGGLEPRDLNGDGIVDAYYDPAQNLSFTADADLPATQGRFEDPAQPGQLDRASALSWAAALDLYGVTGWRLPRVTAFDCQIDSGTGQPYYCAPTASELSLLPSFADFRNLGDFYWLASLVPQYGAVIDGGHYTTFNVAGVGGPPGFGNDTTDEGSLLLRAWAVRDGDLADPVPEPQTWALLLGGLAALGWRARRRARR